MIIEPPVTQRVKATGSHRRMFLSLLFVASLAAVLIFTDLVPGLRPFLRRALVLNSFELGFVVLSVLGLSIITWIQYPVYLGFDERNLYLKRRNGLQVFALDELDWFTCESVPEMPRYFRPEVRLSFSHRGTDHELSRMIPMKEACALARKFVPAEKMLSNKRARKLIWSDLGYYLRGSLRRPEFVFLYVICAAAAGYLLWSVPG